MKRLALALAGLVLVLPTQATAAARDGAWIHPPTDLDTFSNIHGSRATGFTADHWNGHYWANTLYISRRDLLFGYCVSATGTAAGRYRCQKAWDAFYWWLLEHRDSAKRGKR